MLTMQSDYKMSISLLLTYLPKYNSYFVDKISESKRNK